VIAEGPRKNDLPPPRPGSYEDHYEEKLMAQFRRAEPLRRDHGDWLERTVAQLLDESDFRRDRRRHGCIGPAATGVGETALLLRQIESLRRLIAIARKRA